MKKRNPVPVTLLTGYLGAGKTTLLNYVLNNQQGYKVAVIVNDIGEVNIDASLIEKGGQITDTGKKKDSVIPLSNGCICCSLKTDLINQIIEIVKQEKFDYILIEASGICEPIPIAQSIAYLDGSNSRNAGLCRLDNIIAVTDALRLVDEFASGNSLLKKDLDEEDIESLLVQQIEFCNTILINKVDMVSPENLSKVKAVIRVLQPDAKMIETNYGKVDLSEVLNTNRFDFEKVFESAGWVQILKGEDEKTLHHDDADDDDHADDHDHHEEHEHDHHDEHEHEHHDGHHCHEHHHAAGEGHTEEYGVASFVYTRRKPFNRMKLDDLASNWPRNIIRCKGMVWLSDDNQGAMVFETAGKQVSAGYGGDWLATASKAERKRAFADDPVIEKNWDPIVGDRETRLVIIGQHLDIAKITEMLDNCLDEPKNLNSL